MLARAVRALHLSSPVYFIIHVLPRSVISPLNLWRGSFLVNVNAFQTTLLVKHTNDGATRHLTPGDASLQGSMMNFVFWLKCQSVKSRHFILIEAYLQRSIHVSGGSINFLASYATPGEA